MKLFLKVKLSLILIWTIFNITCLCSKAIATERLTTIKDLNIDSNKLVVNREKQLARFEGNVIIYFNNILIKTSRLLVYYKNINNKNVITKLVMPSFLKAFNRCDEELVIADEAVFDNFKKELKITGNMKILKNDMVLFANKMTYIAALESIEDDNKNSKN